MEQQKTLERPISVCCERFMHETLIGIYGTIQHVVLVGGFAASDWLFEKVQSSLTPKGLKVTRPENYVWVSSIFSSLLPS